MMTVKQIKVIAASVVLLMLAFMIVSGPLRVSAQNASAINGGPPVLGWSKFLGPATGTIATVSQAAVAGKRHVVRCISFAATASTAPTLTLASVVIRDGATGVGTVIWGLTVAFPAATGQLSGPFQHCPENAIVGTANTAMTAEFTATHANVNQSINLTGFTVE